MPAVCGLLISIPKISTKARRNRKDSKKDKNSGNGANYSFYSLLSYVYLDAFETHDSPFRRTFVPLSKRPKDLKAAK